MAEQPQRAETRIAGEHVFSGRIISVRVDQVRLPDGSKSVREVVEHPGAVAILPVLDDGRLVLVRQFRYAIGRELLEVPAGTREANEGPRECAIRELREETGFASDDVEELTRFFVSPGWCNEELIVYRARNLRAGDAALEHDEHVTVEIISPADIPALIAAGQIADAKTLTALLAHQAS
jgi:ADP-ribose pyrophosphatase